MRSPHPATLCLSVVDSFIDSVASSFAPLDTNAKATKTSIEPGDRSPFLGGKSSEDGRHSCRCVRYGRERSVHIEREQQPRYPVVRDTATTVVTHTHTHPSSSCYSTPACKSPVRSPSLMSRSTKRARLERNFIGQTRCVSGPSGMIGVGCGMYRDISALSAPWTGRPTLRARCECPLWRPPSRASRLSQRGGE